MVLMRQVIRWYKNTLNAASPNGFTLVEILIAAAIFGAMVVFLLKSVGQISDAIKTTNKIVELNSVRVAVSKVVDCRETLKAFHQPSGAIQNCPASLALKGTDGSDLLNSSEQLDGGNPSWRFRASCGVDSINVKIAIYQGATLLSTKSLGNLDFSNQKINPLVGDGSPFKLCGYMFNTRPRIQSYLIGIASTPEISSRITSADCSKVNHPDAIEQSSSNPKLLMATAGCQDYCRGLEYLDGFITACYATAGKVRCECLR